MKTRLLSIIVCMMSILASCTQSPQDQLRRECEKANAEMPQDLGSSIIARSVSYTDGNVVYHFSCDETLCPLYDEDIFEATSQEMERALKHSTDPEIIALVELCRRADADIVYEYDTAQGNTYRIVIEP